jgi:hypothetical protein
MRSNRQQSSWVIERASICSLLWGCLVRGTRGICGSAMGTHGLCLGLEKDLEPLEEKVQPWPET